MMLHYMSVWGDVLGQWLGSVTARRERMCVAYMYGAALRACGFVVSINVFLTHKIINAGPVQVRPPA